MSRRKPPRRIRMPGTFGSSSLIGTAWASALTLLHTRIV
jgi:hypothetical protein